MNLLENLKLGLDMVFTPEVLVTILLGCLIGTVIGALPGLGPSTGIALLIPVTFTMAPSTGLAFLVSIYMGAMYGGRITSILINTPGDAPAVVTAWDGYPMMKQGKGGLALGISAIASFIGGLIGILVLIFAAPSLAKWALIFGPPEYFAMMLLGFATVASLSNKQYLKSIMMILFGFMIAMVGLDFISGYGRFVYSPELTEGFDFVAIIIGLYGLGEVFYNIETKTKLNLDKKSVELKSLIPKRKDIKQSLGATFRGTWLGMFIGALPGAGGTIATFLSYSTEKNLSKEPQQFGKGKIEGVAGPEAANNASVGGALIPLLALGIPGGGATAVLVGAFIMYGIQPGPRIFETSSDVVWTIFIGLFIANVLLLLTNIFLIPLFVNTIYLGQWYIGPLVTIVSIVGAFSLTYGLFDIWVVLVFGIIGYMLKKLSYPIAPLILAIVLAPMAEDTLRQSLIMSSGNFSIFFTRPVSAIIFLIATIFLVYPVVSPIIKNRMAKNVNM